MSHYTTFMTRKYVSSSCFPSYMLLCSSRFCSLFFSFYFSTWLTPFLYVFFLSYIFWLGSSSTCYGQSSLMLCGVEKEVEAITPAVCIFRRRHPTATLHHEEYRNQRNSTCWLHKAGGRATPEHLLLDREGLRNQRTVSLWALPLAKQHVTHPG